MILIGLTRDLQAGLFSAIVTAFLIKALDDLRPDYQQQAALLLHQLLNGRDPNLENISDPTVPQKPTSSAIAVNCFWFASLSASLGASFGAIICKGWFTEYDSGANPVVGLLRACQRHMRYMAFQRLNVHVLVAFLPALLHSSVFLFFTGVVIYLFQMDRTVAVVSVVIGGIFSIAYLLLTILPFVTNPPFRHYSTFLLYRLSVAILEVIISIVDILARLCYLTLRYVTRTILFPLAQTVFSTGSLHRLYMQAWTFFPGEYKPMGIWWAKALQDPLDDIDTSEKVQEEAILWLSQVPLDPSESKALVSSLALISSSRPCRFQKPVVVFLNLVLEASFHEEDGQDRIDVATDCVIVLGHMKFQSAVDQNSDCDHNIGGIPMPPFVAWVAQQLTTYAFRTESNTSEEIRAQLLAAVAWLSPVEGAEDVEWNGEKLRIQGRFEFIKMIRVMLEQHARTEKPLDNKVLINLIHGMHACIPRGDYGSASSIVPFLPMLCEDYDSPWSEDEAVLRALITYTLDLILLPETRKPLVEREIRFDDHASELIDALMTYTTRPDVVAFAFWLAYRVPYAFKSRGTMLTDIAHIWTLTSEAIPGDHHERMNFHAVDAFVAVAQFHTAANRELPKFTSHATLELLKAGLRYDYGRPMATYAIAMILNLGTPNQVATFTSGITAESFGEALFDVKSDLEKNVTEEDVVDLHIYSTLILSKFQTVELDAGKVKTLIGEMDKAIGDPGVARNFWAEVDPDLDRVRWKAIYLSALLLTFVPEDEKQGLMEGFRARVRVLSLSGGLPLDYECCIEPLVMDTLESSTVAEKRGPAYATFEAWINDFPLVPLAGSVTSAKT